MSFASPLTDDAITRRLATLHGALAAQLSGIADLTSTRDGDFEGFDLRPRRAEALRVIWVQCPDDIDLTVGDSSVWTFPRTAESVERVERAVRAAIDGTVRIGTTWTKTRYEVDLGNGEVLANESERWWTALIGLGLRPRWTWSDAVPYRAGE
jgi:hypothetical protein